MYVRIRVLDMPLTEGCWQLERLHLRVSWVANVE